MYSSASLRDFASDANEKTKYLEKAQNLLNEIEFFEDAQVGAQTETQSTYQLTLSGQGASEV